MKKHVQIMFVLAISVTGATSANAEVSCVKNEGAFSFDVTWHRQDGTLRGGAGDSDVLTKNKNCLKFHPNGYAKVNIAGGTTYQVAPAAGADCTVSGTTLNPRFSEAC